MADRIDLYDGKYTVIDELAEGGGFHALRYGEKWRSLAGDKLVYAMFCEIVRLREAISWGVSCAECSNQLAEDWKIVDGAFVCAECAEGGAD